MKRLIILVVALVLLLATQQLLSEELDRGKGRLSPASLDLDTCGCPTTFGIPVCEQRTQWSITKTTSTGPMQDPTDAPYSFTVAVTEGITEEFLTGEGTMVITNSGDQATYLSSVAVLLEDIHTGPGKGDAPGPSGKNWDILATAVRNKAPGNCGEVAVTCYGDLAASAGAYIQILDSMGNDVGSILSDYPIPPTLDNDGDGLRDEDPALPADPNDITGGCSVIDNDGDGYYDEDPVDFDEDGNPIDNDGDGLFNEDDPDDDGDGLVDEDGACTDGVVIFIRYAFPTAGLGIDGPGDGVVPSDDDLRIDLIATFKAGGRRGGVCSADVDCDGTPDDWVRSIQQRLQFDPVPCTPICQTVTVNDDGASADDPDCVTVTSNAHNQTISATGTAGTTTMFTINGSVSCNGIECDAVVTNRATLTGDGCDGLIEGSPATASFAVMCSEVEPPIMPGDFCTQTQGGWGSTPHGNNPGSVLLDNFETVFDGTFHGTLDEIDVNWVIGENSSAASRCGTLENCGDFLCDATMLPLGHDSAHAVTNDGNRTYLPPYAVLLSTACAVEDFLPQGGEPDVFTYIAADPTSTSAGVFAGQLTAAKINVAFDAAGIRGDGGTTVYPPGSLGTLVYVADSVADPLVGVSVNQVIAWSDCVISTQTGCGVPADVTVSDLSDALATLNENFVDCDTYEGNLAFPGEAPARVAGRRGTYDQGIYDSAKSTPAFSTKLSHNTPNPFNPQTTISFELKDPTRVNLAIFDVAGRLVRELVSESLPAGPHSVVWDGTNANGSRAASGMYFYQMTAGKTVMTKRMLLLK